MKITTTLICSVFFLSSLISMISCSNKAKNSGDEKMWEKFAKIVKAECIKGNEGDPDWEAYCDCGGEC